MEMSSEERKGGVSVHRRLRSGFKDLPVADEDDSMDDEHNDKPRNRSKDSSGLSFVDGFMKAGKSCSSSNKRKRNGYDEPQIQNCSRLSDDVDEKTENTKAPGALDDEEDDDLPPPVLPQRTVNSLPLGKFREGGVLVDLFTVPRRARSGCVPRTPTMKKLQDSPLRVADASAGHSPTAHCRAPPILSSSSFSKQTKQLKLNASKHRSEKDSKACKSPVISEQEVEAAEALSDLSRMFKHAIDSKEVLDVKVELKPTYPAGTSLPATASFPFRAPASFAYPDISLACASSTVSAQTPPLQSASAQTEAPKRKRPHAKSQADAGDSVLKGSKISSVSRETREADELGHTVSARQDRIEPDSKSAASSKAFTALSPPNTHASSSNVRFPVNPQAALPSPMTEGNALIEAPCECTSRAEEMDKVVSYSTEKELRVGSVPDKDELNDPPTPASISKEAEVSKSTLDADASFIEQEVYQSSLHSPAIQEVPPAKLGIDLMTTSKDGIESNGENLGAAVGGFPQRANSLCLEKKAVGIGESPDDNLDKRTAREQVGGAVLDQKLLMQSKKEESRGELSEPAIQHTQEEARNLKAEIGVTAKLEKSGAPYQSCAIASTALLDRASRSEPILSLSMNIPRWSAVLPPVGFYGPAATAATWPGVTSLASVQLDESNSNFQLPSCVIPSCQSWKRCASHVYIAHFISVQQQVAQHPFFAALCGNSAALYGAKPYISLPPADSEHGTVAGAFMDKNVTMTSSLTNILGTNDGGSLGICSLHDDDKAAALTSFQTGAIERVTASNSEGLSRNSLEQHLQAEKHRSSMAALTSASTGSCISTTRPLSFTGTIGGLGILGGTSGKTGADYTQTVGPEAHASQGISMNTSTAMSMTSAQAQYLQALIQHNSFPFIFPPQFGSAFSNSSVQVGHQQSPQFLNSPYSQLHLQQQLVGVGLSPPHNHSQRAEDTTVVQANTLMEKKHSSVQQSFYGHTLSGTHAASSGNLSPITSSMLQTRSILPDLGPTLGLGPKQNSKSQLQQPVPHVQEHLSSLPTHLLATQLQSAGSSTSFSVCCKGIDSQSSHVFHGMSVPNMIRGSVGPGPLGLGPVAAVMAPEGHAVLPNVVDPMKSLIQYQQSQFPHSHHLTHQANQQQQRPLHAQKSSTGLAGEIRSVVDGSSYSGPVREDRKSAAKRVGSMQLPRVEFESKPNTFNDSCANEPKSLPLCNGNLEVQSAVTLASHSIAKGPSVNSSASNMSANLTIKQTVPKVQVSTAQNLVASSSSLPSFTERAPIVVSSTKSPSPAPPFPPSGQRQSQTQPAAMKSLPKLPERLVSTASDHAQGLSLVAGKVHMQQPRSTMVVETASAPRLSSPVATNSPVSSATPPLPRISKSTSTNSTKSAGTGKDSLNSMSKAAPASAKRIENPMSTTTTASQNLASKNVKLQQQAQQVQTSPPPPSILPTSFQQSSPLQHFQQHQSQFTQQPVQLQKRSLQQHQQVRQPIFLQQPPPYLQQQRQSSIQVHSKSQQNQANLHQPQQHVGAKPSSQTFQQGSLSEQQLLQHLQQQKHCQLAVHPLGLSNPTETSPSPSLIVLGTSNSSYAGAQPENLASEENGIEHTPGRRHNYSGPLCVTGAYLRSGPNVGALQKTDDPARELVSGNVSSARLSPSKIYTVMASSLDLHSSDAKTSTVTPNGAATTQSSAVNSAENISSSTLTASVKTSSSNSMRPTSTLNSDGGIKSSSPCTDSTLGSNGEVSIAGTSASVQQGDACTLQTNVPSTHQISLSTSPVTSVNVSSCSQIG